MNDNRKYNPTFAELIDALVVNQLKELKLDNSYKSVIDNIVYDIDQYLLDSEIKMTPKLLLEVLYLSLSHNLVWDIKDKMVSDDSYDYDSNLKIAQDLNNGLRSSIKNFISKDVGEYSEARKSAIFIKDNNTINKITDFVNDK
jgi:hypothetical protein